MVTECGCTECSEHSVIILGLVMEVNTYKPISTASIFINGSEIGNAVNSEGQFMIEIPKGVRRFIVTVTDKADNYADNTKVIHFPSKPLSVIYSVVQMLPLVQQPNIDPTEYSVINVGDSQPFAQVVIPPNSIYTMDGLPYSGSVTVKSGIVDPANLSSVLNSPGDFSALDDRGSLVRLKTYGMVSLRLTDPTSGALLQVKDKVHMVLDNTVWGNEIDEDGNPLAKLWSMNTKSGNWELTSSMQKGNQSFPQWRHQPSVQNAGLFSDIIVGDTEIDGRTWTNFDGNEYRACYSKVRIFEDSRFLETTQLTGMTVTMVSLHKNSKTVADVSTYRALSDDGDSNGYCVIGFCDVSSGDDYEGYIIAEENTAEGPKQLHAADENNNAHYIGMSEETAHNLEYESIVHDTNPALFTRFAVHEIAPGEVGPLYEWTDTGTKLWTQSETCSRAAYSENHYRFYREEHETCGSPTFVHEEIECPDPDPSHINWLAWFPESNDNHPTYSTCYVKVLIENGMNKTFNGLSAMGNCTHPEGEVKVNDTYGNHQVCPTSDREAFCIEVKHAGIPTDCNNVHTCEHMDETLISIEQLPDEGSEKSCKITEIKPELQFILGHKMIGNKETFKMYLDEDNKGKIYGIYCARNLGSAEAVRASAFQQCANANDDYLNLFAPYSINENHYALKFTCE